MPEWENSDDSIKDPDFIINNTVTSSDSHPESEKSEVLDIPFNYDDPQSKIKNKKRLCQTLRNTGKSYKTLSGKVKHARVPKPFGMCRSNCQDKISFEQIKQLFNQYWALGTYDQRILYIGSLLTIGDKKCNILSNAMQRKRGRETSVKYFLEYDGMRTQVCRKHFTICFLKRKVSSKT